MSVIPFLSTNFFSWMPIGVGETEWLYTCTFDAPTANEGSSHRLTFDGLDTLCDVYLVNILILLGHSSCTHIPN